MRVACNIELTKEEREILDKWARGRSISLRKAQRAKIVLRAAEGLQNRAIAAELGMTLNTVGIWRNRFSEKRLAGIEKDAPRGGRRPKKRADLVRKIIEMTTQTKPKNATHWSVRTLASELQTNTTLVHRVWKANGLKPHLVKTFKISNDKYFIEKMTDVIGLYLNPPEHALVFCADEKSQIQALDRTQPSLPMIKGRCGTMTHDYQRNGTTTLFAAMELAEGKIIGTCMKRHRHQEWIKFLNLIDTQTPLEKEIHLIIDNYSTHKHQKVQQWQKKHPRFHFHFIPTSSSWLNLVERWLGKITQSRLRRGSFRSVQELIDAILDYIDQSNAEPKPFIWTAGVKETLEKIERARKTLHNLSSE